MRPRAQRFLGGGRPFGYRIVENAGVNSSSPAQKEQRAIKTMRHRFEDGASIKSLLTWAKDRGYQISYRALYKLHTSEQ